MKYRFFFHYNKPLSRKTGGVVWSLHFRKTCHMVGDIQCLVPTNTKTNKTQPYAVVQGFCSKVEVENGVAVIS